MWEQILVFPKNSRYFFCTDRVISVNKVDNIALMFDILGYLKNDKGDSFLQIYLSYYGTIPNSEFLEDFPPDAKYRYVHGENPPNPFIQRSIFSGLEKSYFAHHDLFSAFLEC